MNAPQYETSTTATVAYQAADPKHGFVLAELIVFVESCRAAGIDPSSRVQYDATWRGTLKALRVEGQVTQP